MKNSINTNQNSHCPNTHDRKKTVPEVIGMVNNEEYPIGFTMELA